MSEMAAKIEHRNFDILDINMGCPVPKVVNNGEGSALMKDPKLAGQIVKAISDRIQKPVTVKFRKGFNDGQINAVEFAKYMEENGAAAVAAWPILPARPCRRPASERSAGCRRPAERTGRRTAAEYPAQRR